MLKNRIIWSIGLVVACATLTVVIQGQLAETGAKEFTIIMKETTRTLPNGIPHEALVFYAQRQDGSSVRGPYAPSDHTRYGTVRVVLLRPSGQRVLVDDTQRLKTTTYLSLEPLTGRPTDPMCGFSRIGAKMKPSYKGIEQILGFHSVMIETLEGPYLHTVWKAPALDCNALKLTENRRNEGGEVTGQFTMQATDIKLGAPDPKYFTIPTDYKETSPSEMEASRRQRYQLTTPKENVIQGLRESDKRYIENQRNHGRN